ncbi:MAG: hypothetical protein IKN39_01795 [Clostridia bacterium]|nr:hypothetical protein [Clostridia bacterium]
MNDQNAPGGGWICLWRDLLDKPIWCCSTPEQKTILITLLLMANHKPNKWEFNGKLYEVQAGQFVTSLPNIVKKCGKNITVQKVRTTLKRFEKLGFLTDKSTRQNRLITIVNWAKYQVKDYLSTDDLTDNQQTLNRQLTDNQQTLNRQLTANNNDNNDNNVNNDNKSISISNDIDCCTDVQRITSEWNTLEVYGIKKVVKIASGTKRHNALRARIKQYSLDAVISAIDNIRLSDFLQGKNNKGWVITFDWFVMPNNFIKVLEGNYTNTISQSNKTESTGNPYFDLLREMEEEKRKRSDTIDV